MHLDFEYTPDDIRELLKVARANNPKGLRRPRLVLGLCVAVVASVSLLAYLVDRKFGGESSLSTDSGYWRDRVGVLIAVAAVVVIASIIQIRARFPSNTSLLKRLGNERPVSMDLGEGGVRMVLNTSETCWRWESFDRLVETDQRFFLRLTKSTSFVIIPKLAMGHAEVIDASRQLFRNHIQPVTGAFPVIPL
jgi:hypothetical protein